MNDKTFFIASISMFSNVKLALSDVADAIDGGSIIMNIFILKMNLKLQ